MKNLKQNIINILNEHTINTYDIGLVITADRFNQLADIIIQNIECDDNKHVDMSENDMNKLHDWEMFKVFAKLHPIEAYDERNKDFCIFMREEGYDMTDEQIKEFIDSSRESCP